MKTIEYATPWSRKARGLLILGDYLCRASMASVRYRSLRPPAKHIRHNFEFLCKLTHPGPRDRYWISNWILRCLEGDQRWFIDRRLRKKETREDLDGPYSAHFKRVIINLMDSRRFREGARPRPSTLANSNVEELIGQIMPQSKPLFPALIKRNIHERLFSPGSFERELNNQVNGKAAFLKRGGGNKLNI